MQGFPAGAETIELENPDDIKLAAKLNQSMDNLSSKVMNCIDEGGTIEQCGCTECSCKFTAEYAAFKKAYKDALATYPDWDEKIIFYQLEGNPTGYNINFAGLKKQFSMKCE